MKHPLIVLGIAGAASIFTTAANADNPSVENAIKKRSDLSSFYQALVNTGVNHELNAGMSYTVLAPTNDAFAKIRQDQYPCFYTSQCRAQVAQIVRNHIIPGSVYVDNAAEEKGGLYSISGRFVAIGEPSRNDYTADGNNILRMSQFAGGMLYKLDGVIVNPRELAAVEYPDYAELPEGRSVSTTTMVKKTIPDPACGPGGCPDRVTQTTIIRTTVPPASMLEPSR